VYDHIWNAIDEEIARLRQARTLLEGAATRPTRGTGKKTSARAISGPVPRRTLSAKARHAIAEAQRRRWAKVHALKKSAAV
jgi:ribonucleotide reductase alpha subunit